MTVWYLDNEDCSGVFSTREKAIESFENCAERCDWVVLEHQSEGWGDVFIYAWRNFDGGTWSTDSVAIVSYVLDEDNGI